VHPGAIEVCDGKDNNCDGVIDESCGAITVTASKTASSSCVDDGTITLSRTGGTSPFKYSLDGVHYQTSNKFTGLAAGTYIGFVKDSKNTLGTLSGIIIIKTAPVVVSASTTAASFCVNDGTITLGKTGGTSPFTYSLDGVTYQTSNKFTGLAAGTYTGYVKDVKCAAVSLTGIVVAKTAAVVVTASKTAASSCMDDGTITLGKTGGTSPFTYSLDGVHYQTSNVFTGLAAGTYAGYVKDAKCPAGSLTGIVITKTASVAVTASKTAASSCMDDGTITLGKTGGTSPFTYSLDGVTYQTSNKFTGLAAGTYTGYVKDAKCAAVSLTGIVVTKTASVVVTASKTAASSCMDDGTITLGKTGGTSPFTYSLDGVTYQTSNKFTGLAAGTYTGYVKDAKCAAVSLTGIVVAKTASVVVTASKTNATPCYTNGTITLTRTGGVSPFTYSLDGVNYQTSNKFTGLAAGTYTGWVKDAKCPAVSLSGITVTTSTCYSISSSSSTGGENSGLKVVNTSMRIFPNPANDVLHVELRGYSGKVTLQLRDMAGKALLEKKLDVQTSDVAETQLNTGTFASGVYLLTAINENGNMRTEKVLVAH
jgi:hypothetical protein